MTAKHTPGPWNHKPVNGKCAGLVFGTQPGRTYGRVIARVTDCGGGSQEAIANRTLIAAAPELLEAAEWLMAELSSRFDYETATPEEQTIFCHMENVIAKARGDK